MTNLERQVEQGIGNIDQVRDAKERFKENYRKLLNDTKTATGIGIANDNTYYIALRSLKRYKDHDQFPTEYLNIPVAILYIDYKLLKP